MPIISRTTNKVQPANTRSVDVAKSTLRDLIPVQQRRYANAFEVDGHEVIVYNRLHSGMKCSCQAHGKSLATILDEDGKMPQGTINEFLTGGMEFRVQRYGTRSPIREDLRDADDAPLDHEGQQREGMRKGSKRIAGADYIVANNEDIDEVADILDEGSAVNGPARAETLEDDIGDFDGYQSLNDTPCGVCLGTGYVGGFSVLNGYRVILGTTALPKPAVKGTIEANVSPHAFFATEVTFTVVLPKHVVDIDAFRVWNNFEIVSPKELLIDGLPYSTGVFLAKCDGLPHQVKVKFDELTTWTHVEIQANQTRHPVRVEFPKFTFNDRLELQNPTDDVSLAASPLIPRLLREDIIADSTSGHLFLVGSATSWATRNRNQLGWDCNARVVQPSELLAALPRRKNVAPKSTNLVLSDKQGTPGGFVTKHNRY